MLDIPPLCGCSLRSWTHRRYPPSRPRVARVGVRSRSGRPMKILSLDGGGTWALIQARALGALFGANTAGHDILRWFDLVAANSGGSIVAGALAANFSPAQIATLFREQVKTIFVPRADGLDRWIGKLIGLDAPWSAEQKLYGLQRALSGLGTRTLPQVQASAPGLPHFLISTYDYDRRRVRFFRSY